MIKDLKSDSAMRPILSGLLLFILLYLIADFFVKNSSIGLFSDALTLSLLGNADEFLDPISEAYFLELLHAETFFLMMILLTLSTVYIRLYSKAKLSLLLLNITMATAITSLIALGLSFYLSISFINVYVISFFIWHTGAIVMSLLSYWRLYFD